MLPREPRASTSISLPAPTSASDQLVSQLAEQGEIVQSMFDAFRILTEENVRKEKRIEKLEQSLSEMKEFVFLNMIENLNILRDKIGKFDKFESIESEMSLMKRGIDDLKFFVGSSNPTRMIRDTSPSRDLLGLSPSSRLPASDTSPQSIGLKQQSMSLDRVQNSLDSILAGIEYVTKQRNADVTDINTSLESLDSRIREMAKTLNTACGIEVSGNPATDVLPEPQRVLWQPNVDVSEIKAIKDQILPVMESEFNRKFDVLSNQLALARSDVEKSKSDFSSLVERLAVREAKITQLLNQLETAKRSEVILNEQNNRIAKLDGDIAFVFEEMKRVEELIVSGEFGGGSGGGIESKLDLVRSESKSNWERVNRQVKLDMDSLRVKIERISVVRDEYERLSGQVRELQDLVVGGGSLIRKNFASSATSQDTNGGGMPSLIKAASVTAAPLSSLSHDSSILSVVDEGIGSANTHGVAHPSNTKSEGMVHQIRAQSDPLIQISVPTGGAEMGSLRVDGPTNRIVWRIDNMEAVIRDMSRYPRIFVSPEFVTYSPQNDVLTGRMKLFPQGSDQSRIDGYCSFYLRCIPGITVRFSVDVAGELIETFECEYEKQRDKGKHDFVKLNEMIDPDGSLTVGLDIRSIKPRTDH